jgi:hypothetical protein
VTGYRDPRLALLHGIDGDVLLPGVRDDEERSSWWNATLNVAPAALYLCACVPLVGPPDPGCDRGCTFGVIFRPITEARDA